MTSPEWRVETRDSIGAGANDGASVPLKWAHDAETGAARYIHDPEVVDERRRCLCPACQLPLTPVNAGKPQGTHPTPHFHHPEGSRKDNCMLIAARLAITRQLAEIGIIELPRRGMSRTAQGFSGQGYEIWAERPISRVRVSSTRLYDHATALLTLDDGRELLVDLTGQREPGEDSHGRGIVTLSLSDPEIAQLGPEEIRARLRILPDMRWCSHWEDRQLVSEAQAAAEQSVLNNLDGWGAAEEEAFRKQLPPDLSVEGAQRLRRETLLHRSVKAILEETAAVQTPELKVRVFCNQPEEFPDEWGEEVISLECIMNARQIALEKVRLEHPVGAIVPDVLADLKEPIRERPWTVVRVDGEFEEIMEDTYGVSWPSTLLVEVTVTHGIDAQKLQRLRALDLPVLEINLSSLGGRVTMEGLRNLVVHETIGKRWIHHPVIDSVRHRLERDLERHPAAEELRRRLFEFHRPSRLERPVSEWADAYLAAAIAFYDASVASKRLRKSHRGPGPKPRLLDKGSNEWADLREMAECLAAHSVEGALDAAMVGETGVIPRLLSLQSNRGIGYDLETGGQVLNAIMQSGDWHWSTVFNMAVKSYGLDRTLSSNQLKKYEAWRQDVIDMIDARDPKVMRPGKYDALLRLLFPELIPVLVPKFRQMEPDR